MYFYFKWKIFRLKVCSLFLSNTLIHFTACDVFNFYVYMFVYESFFRQKNVVLRVHGKKKTFIMLTNIEKLPIKSELGTRYIFFDTLVVSNKRCLTKRITSYFGVLRQLVFKHQTHHKFRSQHQPPPVPWRSTSSHPPGGQPPPILSVTQSLLAVNLHLSLLSTSNPPGGQSLCTAHTSCFKSL